MEFVTGPTGFVDSLIFAGLFVLCVVGIVGGGTLVSMKNDEETSKEVARRWAWPGRVALAIGLISGALMAYQYFSNQFAWKAHYEAVWAEVEETYGLDLTDDEKRALDFPSEKPEEDFETFGSFTREGPTASGFSRETVYLIWKDGLLHLAESADGEQFTTLDSAD